MSNIFSGSICPDGWIPSGSGDPCKVGANTWDCWSNEVGKPNTCTEVFTGNGQYSSLADCQAGCNPSSWKCIGPSSGGTCIEVFDGTGGFLTLADCQVGCSGRGNDNGNNSDDSQTNGVSAESWRCNPDGGCTDPGDGSGTYSTLGACVAACSNNEEPPPQPYD